MFEKQQKQTGWASRWAGAEPLRTLHVKLEWTWCCANRESMRVTHRLTRDARQLRFLGSLELAMVEAVGVSWVCDTGHVCPTVHAQLTARGAGGAGAMSMTVTWLGRTNTP